MEDILSMLEDYIASEGVGEDQEELEYMINRAISEIRSLRKTKDGIVERNKEIRAAEEKEIRAYVEANGFEWEEDKSMVFNVTTVIGLLGGTVEAIRKQSTGLDGLFTMLQQIPGTEEYSLDEMMRGLGTTFGVPFGMMDVEVDMEEQEKIAKDMIDEVIANKALCVCGNPHKKEIDPDATMQLCDDCMSALEESIDPYDGDN